MKKHQLGNYGPDDLDGYKIFEKDKALELYNQKYAGKPVTIFYNPDDINEFYVKEIEEKVMLQSFKDLKKTRENNFFVKRFKGIILLAVIVLGVSLLSIVVYWVLLNILASNILN